MRSPVTQTVEYEFRPKLSSVVSRSHPAGKNLNLQVGRPLDQLPLLGCVLGKVLSALIDKGLGVVALVCETCSLSERARAGQ